MAKSNEHIKATNLRLFTFANVSLLSLFEVVILIEYRDLKKFGKS